MSVKPDPDAALRADIRRLGRLLGQTLVRQEGQALLDLVEEVTGAGPQRRGRGRRAGCPRSTWVPARKLARAFSTYFHLANITEQVHRARELRRQRARHGGWLDQAARLISERGVPADEIAAAARRLAIRPVFTAHPTEAARRSILSKLRGVADELDAEAAQAALFGTADAGGARTATRTDRRLAELIDLLWQTDELRLDRPDPTDEARNAVYYLADLYADAAPQVLADLAETLRELGVETAPTARPLTFGTLDRRRPRRQPVRDAGGHPRRADDPARARHPGRRGGDRRADRRAVGLPPAARGLPGPVRQPRRRPGAPARAGRPVPPGQRRGAVPAQGALHPGEAGQHPRPAGRAGTRTCPAATTAAPPS